MEEYKKLKLEYLNSLEFDVENIVSTDLMNDFMQYIESKSIDL